MAALKSARLWMGSLLICTWAASAHAQNLCEENKDCPTGYQCETLVGMTAPCTAAPCKMGEACEPAPDCVQEPIEYKQCTPVSCETDADCGERAVCHAQTLSECSAGAAVACAPNEMCPQPEPSCTEHTIKQCLARYVLPCEQDNDCGEGFSCQALEECTCAGSGASASDPAAATDAGTSNFAPVAPTEDAGVAQSDAAVGGCECHTRELKHCELKQLSCGSDADCPSDFVCVSSSDNAVACVAASDGGAEAASCDVAPAPADKRCEPRFWAGFGPTPGSVDKGAGGPIYGDGGSTSAPQDSSRADAGITPDEPSTEGTGTPADDSSSCSVSGVRSGSFNTWLAVFGLVPVGLGLRSRRKQH